MGKMINFFCLLLLLISFAPHTAYCQEVERIEIIDFGIYDAETTRTVEDKASLIGHRTLSKNIRLIEQTDKIPMKLGVRFGFRYKVVGHVDGVTVKLTKETTRPETTNTETGKKSSRHEYSFDRTIGTTSYTGFIFEKEWELVAGEYKMTLSYNGRKLAEKTFNIVP